MRALMKTSPPATAAITAAWAGSLSWSSRLTPATGPSRATYSATSAGSVLNPFSMSAVTCTGRCSRRRRGRPSPPRSRPRRRAGRARRRRRGSSCRPPGSRRRRASPRKRDPTRSAAPAGRPGTCRSAKAVISRELAGASPRTPSITPAASARAWASPGQRRGPAPNGRPARAPRRPAVRRDALRRRHRRRVAQHVLQRPLEPAAHQRRRRLAGLHEQRDVLCRDLRLGRGQRREQPRERLVGAGCIGPGLIGGGDDPHVGRRHRRSTPGRRAAPRPARTRASSCTTPGCESRRSPRRRAARPGRARRAARSTSARRRACVSPSAKRETVARSHAIVPNGPGRARGGDGVGRASADATGATFRCPPKRRARRLTHDRHRRRRRRARRPDPRAHARGAARRPAAARRRARRPRRRRAVDGQRAPREARARPGSSRSGQRPPARGAARRPAGRRGARGARADRPPATTRARSACKQVNGRAALREARSCYDHLAGRAGVALADDLLARGALIERDGASPSRPTPRAHYLERFGVDPGSLHTRRPLARACTDWTERRPHVAGALGAALLTRCSTRAGSSAGPTAAR